MSSGPLLPMLDSYLLVLNLSDVEGTCKRHFLHLHLHSTLPLIRYCQKKCIKNQNVRKPLEKQALCNVGVHSICTGNLKLFTFFVMTDLTLVRV